jgi:hypothetical protein
MYDCETTKEVLLSIINLGERSPLFDRFYNICLHLSIATINLTKNRIVREEILSRLGYSFSDLARDCIDELFETRDHQFVQLTKYFEKNFPDGIEDVHPNILQAHLGKLIKSKTSQQISELRQNLGDIYFDIRKSVSTDLNRKKKQYKKFTRSGIVYICTDHNIEVDLEKPQIDKSFLLPKLFSIKFRLHNISKVLPEVFEIINSQNEFCKAIKEKHLLEILKDFYMEKIKDSIEANITLNKEFVEYIDINRDDELFSPETGEEDDDTNY